MNIAIVTGAAGGIGKEFIKLMLKEPGVDEIWAVGRTESKLLKLVEEFGDKVVPAVCDITSDESILNLAKTAKEKNAHVKWLINCAGTRALYKENAEFSRLLATIRTNCVGSIAMCFAFIPFMGEGDIILNVSSAASFQPLPYNNTYAAAKVALRFFSKGLAHELSKKGIQVTCSCPGWVATELMEFKNGEIVPMEKLPGVTTAENVAKKSVKGARKGKFLIFPTLKVHVDYYITKYSPTEIVIWWWKHVEADHYDRVKNTNILT